MVEKVVPPTKNAAFQQLFSFGTVGVAANLVGYCLYLLLTQAWLDPKAAVSLLYPVGVLIGYFGHSKWSFSYDGSHRRGILRYFQAHCVGYLTNLVFLYLLVDLLGYPHALIQAIAIVIVSGLLFVLYRYYVFPRRVLS